MASFTLCDVLFTTIKKKSLWLKICSSLIYIFHPNTEDRISRKEMLVLSRRRSKHISGTTETQGPLKRLVSACRCLGITGPQDASSLQSLCLVGVWLLLDHLQWQGVTLPTPPSPGSSCFGQLLLSWIWPSHHLHYGSWDTIGHGSNASQQALDIWEQVGQSEKFCEHHC